MSIKGSPAKYKAHTCHVMSYRVTVEGNSLSSSLILLHRSRYSLTLCVRKDRFRQRRRRRRRKVAEKQSEAEERGGGGGHMDYSAQVVTSPDSALYNKELSNACSHPVSVG